MAGATHVGVGGQRNQIAVELVVLKVEDHRAGDPSLPDFARAVNEIIKDAARR